MDDDGFDAPSRERFREERHAIRRAERRRKLLAFPIVVAGLGLVSAGIYVFMQGEAPADVPTAVQGTSVTRSEVTSTTSTTPPTPVPAGPTTTVAGD